MDFDRLQILLQRYFDQVLTKAEVAELEWMLLAYPKARDEFWEASRLHAMIRQWGEAEWGARQAAWLGQEVAAPPPGLAPAWKTLFRRGAWRAARPVAFAAAGALALILGRLLFSTPSKEVSPANRTVVAMLVSGSDVRWGEKRFQAGQTLGAGWLEIRRGAALLEFSRGARLIVEGPAEVNLVSENEVFLRSGRLRAFVPAPAQGFRMVGAGFQLVDHGAEFGCVASSAGLAELDVFSGSVSLSRPGGTVPERVLNAGHALWFKEAKTLETAAEPGRFLDEPTLATREAAYAQDRLRRWRESAREIRENPSTLLFFDFEDARHYGRTLANTALGAPAESAASVVGGEVAEGRWPGKKAMGFTRASDRLRLDVPVSLESMTALAWVRVDDLPHHEQSLVRSQSFSPGEFHLYLTAEGALGFDLHAASGLDQMGWRRLRSQPGVMDDKLGAWVLVAFVYSGPTGEAAIYCNGIQAARGLLGGGLPLRLDVFEIGNAGMAFTDPRCPPPRCSTGVRRNSPGVAALAGDEEPGLPAKTALDRGGARHWPGEERNFVGRMDEIAILNVGLPEEAVRHAYLVGRPDEAASTGEASGRSEGIEQVR